MKIITIDQIKSMLEERRQALNKVSGGVLGYVGWRNVTLTTIDAIYGKESDVYRAFNECSNTSLESLQKQANDLFDTVLKQLAILGPPEKVMQNEKIHNQFIIYQEQNQQQSQSIERAIQELPKEIIDKIQNIIQQGDSKTSITRRIFDAVKELEIGTVASVLATILTDYYWKP